MPQNPEMERVIHLAKNAVEQLERQNPLSSLHGTRSRATATVIPQASCTPGGHHRQQQLEEQNQRNQEDQEVASNHRSRANQAPGPQPNRNNNNRGHNREEVADSIVDTRDIINARCRSQLADNSDRFQALSRDFDNVEYPKDFKPTNIQKYDGKHDPAQWLYLYSTAVSVAGGDTNTKVLYFPMALEPAPLTWLESLACESIYSWEDLKKAFVDNFQGSLDRVATRHALSRIKQEQGESIRSYVKRFFDTRATIPNVKDDDIIDYFQ